MKKGLLILILLLAAFGLTAEPVVTWHGRLMYGVIYDPETNATGSGFSYAEVLSHVAISEFTAIDTELNVDAAFKPFFAEFSGAVQIGKKLGTEAVFNPVLRYGWATVGATTYTNSGYAYENLIAYGPGARPTLAMDVGLLNNTLHALVSINPTDLGATPDFLANLYGTMGPFNLSVAYYTNNHPEWAGLLGFDGGYRYKLGDLSGSIDAEASFDLATATVKYGAGVAAAYKKVSADWSFWADDTKFQAHGIGMYYTLTPIVNLYLGTQMVNNGKYFIDSIEPSVVVVVGQARIRMGYLYDPAGTGTGMFYAPGALPAGAFVKLDISY